MRAVLAIALGVACALSSGPARAVSSAAPPTESSTNANEPVVLSERLGEEIDRVERDRYGLFPDIERFTWARIYRVSDSRYRVEYAYECDGYYCYGERRIDAGVFERTRVHVRLVEDYLDARGSESSEVEARLLYRMALRQCTERRYDEASRLLDELERSYPEHYEALQAERIRDDVRELAGAPRTLYSPQGLIDQSGRTDVLIFSGYYGLWLGIAVPAALEADTPEAYAAGLLFVPAFSVLVGHLATKNRDVTDADASLISSGGWLGTLHGLGWAGVADKRGEEVLAWGIAGGLGGITLAMGLNAAFEFSEGHAALTGSALWWGGWLGFLTALGAGLEEDDVLKAALIGSGGLTVVTALAAHDTPLTRRRVRFMNLGGFLGAAGGAGVLLLATPDDEPSAALAWGLCTVAGGYIGIRASRPASEAQALAPIFELRSGLAENPRDRVPMVGASFSF
ncbi:MAG: hypothetical protein OEO21_13125 [Candidatus Krumholzibacteria bacterium]|nr:hypothetical protein [Candidatus Krumholzibacteria bacterium]